MIRAMVAPNPKGRAGSRMINLCSRPSWSGDASDFLNRTVGSLMASTAVVAPVVGSFTPQTMGAHEDDAKDH
jgi:hypothetical protein